MRKWNIKRNFYFSFISNISIPIQNLTPGAYIVQVKDEKDTVVLKMVKE